MWRYPGTSFTTVLGMVKGKDVEGMVKELLPVTKRFVLTNPRTPRGSELEALKTAAATTAVETTVIPYIERLDQLPFASPLLFTGSFFTALVGEQLLSQHASG